LLVQPQHKLQAKLRLQFRLMLRKRLKRHPHKVLLQLLKPLVQLQLKLLPPQRPLKHHKLQQRKLQLQLLGQSQLRLQAKLRLQFRLMLRKRLKRHPHKVLLQPLKPLV
jgi:hypothetical protein